eukprot:5816266-Pleurochrysis_carterae.AAC.3
MSKPKAPTERKDAIVRAEARIASAQYKCPVQGHAMHAHAEVQRHAGASRSCRHAIKPVSPKPGNQLILTHQMWRSCNASGGGQHHHRFGALPLCTLGGKPPRKTSSHAAYSLPYLEASGLPAAGWIGQAPKNASRSKHAPSLHGVAALAAPLCQALA